MTEPEPSIADALSAVYHESRADSAHISPAAMAVRAVQFIAPTPERSSLARRWLGLLDAPADLAVGADWMSLEVLRVVSRCEASVVEHVLRWLAGAGLVALGPCLEAPSVAAITQHGRELLAAMETL